MDKYVVETEDGLVTVQKADTPEHAIRIHIKAIEEVIDSLHTRDRYLRSIPTKAIVSRVVDTLTYTLSEPTWEVSLAR